MLVVSVIALLTACGPTGNRLNIGVISDPRTQFDPNDTTGNQGTVTPTDAGANVTVADPSLTPIPPGGGSSTSSNTNQQTRGSITPGGIFALSTSQPSTLASAPFWTLVVYADDTFKLQHRAKPYGGIDLQLMGVRTTQPNGSQLFQIQDRLGDGLPNVRQGTTVSAIEWTERLIVLNGDELTGHGLIAVSVGTTCPTSDISGIWLGNSATTPSLPTGTLNYTASSATATQSIAVDARTGETLVGHSFMNGACGKAVALGTISTLNSAETHFISLSSTGIGVMTNGSAQQALSIATPAPVSLADLSGDYVGMHGSGGAIEVATIHCDDLGRCTGDGSVSLQFDAFNTVANGTIIGRFAEPDGAFSPMSCIAGIDAGPSAQMGLLTCHVDGTSTEDLFFVRKTP